LKNPYTPVSRSTSENSTFAEVFDDTEPEATEYENPTTGAVKCIIEESGNLGTWVEADGGSYVYLSDLQ
jgi:hypothetical protein